MNINLDSIDINIRNVSITSGKDIFYIMLCVLAREKKVDIRNEYLWVIALNNALNILNIESVLMGQITHDLIRPTELLVFPREKEATGLMIVRSTPKGNLEPTDSDKDLVNKLIQACLLARVPVLDYITITSDSYFSFKASGLLKELEKSLKYVPPYKIESRALKVGKEKGRKEREKEIARQMLSDGEPVDKIQKWTGLSKVAIKNIKP